MAKLYRCKRNHAFVTYSHGERQVVMGKVYTGDELGGFSEEQIADLFVEIRELPTTDMPKTVGDIATFCDQWIRFCVDPIANDIAHPNRFPFPKLADLWDAVVSIVEAPAPPVKRDAASPSSLPNLTAVAVLKQFRDWAKQVRNT